MEPTVPNAPPPVRLAVFLSGGGRTLLNLVECIRQGNLSARVELVASNRPCAGIERAAAIGLRTQIIPSSLDPQDLGQLLREAGVELVVLAGYLKLFRIPPGYERRVVNIHPALLPKFGGPGMYGAHVHSAVLAAGETESGCTVHYCDAHYDRGDIILQLRCPVLPGDTPDTLAARVFAEECIAYPRALQKVIEELRAAPRCAASKRPTHAG